MAFPKSYTSSPRLRPITTRSSRGLGDGTWAWNIATGIAMLLGRFLSIILPLAIVGSLMTRRRAAENTGTLGVEGVEITAFGQTKPKLSPTDRAAAEWVMQHGEAAGLGTDTPTASAWQFRPLKTAPGTLAVLGFRGPPGRKPD